MHVKIKTGSRSNGQSAFAHSSYITRTGKYQRLASKRGADEAVSTGHLNMPEWAVSVPAKYWNAADEGERSNGRLFTSVEVALPRELDRDQRAKLALEFVRRLATENLEDEERRPVTWAIHADPDDHNPHLHICLSERVNDGGGRGASEWFKHAAAGAPKRPLKSRDYIPHVRSIWEEMTNAALERAGSAARVDRRSYAEQGSEKVPGVHFGPSRHRALRERKQGKSPSEIVGQDQALKRALQARRARSIRVEIAALEAELSTMHPPVKSAVQAISNSNTRGGEPMSNPGADADRAERELRARAKWTGQSVEAQLEEEEMVRRAQADPNNQAQVQGLRREYRDRMERDRLFEQTQAQKQVQAERAEVERQLGIHQSADATILAGASSDQIEQAGSRALRPIELALAGYVARKIVTTRGYEAVAYTRAGEPRPYLIDYGNEVRAYGAASPEEHRERAAAMIELGTQKGWNTRRFWGGEEWLKATYLEAHRAGVPWSVDKQRSAYVPDAATLAAWDKEAQAEAATAEQGASDGDGASYTTEKAADDENESQAAEEPKDNPYAGWSRQQMLDRLTHLRRKHGCEFEDDDEQDREGPSYGA